MSVGLRRLTSLSIHIISLLVLYAGVLLGVILWQARRDEATSAQAIIVLGAAQFVGRPSPVYRARLDHALKLYRAGFAPHIALTGGRGPGDTISEAEVGRNYLMARGVPAAALLLETQSHTTYQNLLNLQPIFAQEGITIIVLVSDGFHLFRAKQIAHYLGWRAYASPAAPSAYTPYGRLEWQEMLSEVWLVSEFWFRSVIGALN